MNIYEKSYAILEFNKIKNLLTQYCATEYAKTKVDCLKPILNETELKRAMNETNGARTIIDSLGNPPIPSTDELKTLLDISEKQGILYPLQLEKIVIFIASCRRLKTYLKKAQATNAALAFSSENIDTLDDIFTEINRCIRGDDVNTDASKVLCDIRKSIDKTNNDIKTKLSEIIKSNKKYCAESFVTIKNGHYTIPVKKEYKNQITGSVIALSSTETTYFIEPSQVIKFTEKLNSLQIEEELEKEKILYTLTALIDSYNTQIRLNCEICEKADFAFAKGKLSYEMDAVTPKINTDRTIEIIKGRHPLLNKDICVPIDFVKNNIINGVVITGPNTGGKTVALKLIGLFSIMAQSGLHIPCERANISMNNNILCDIGDGQNISENLSTFSSHIKNVIEILENTDRESLVLLDELGSGTDPAEGMGIAVSILEELRKSKCNFVATTHYPEVKVYAEKTPGLINARMAFDKETLQPLYRLDIGKAGESCALYIARKLGLPDNMLRFAYNQTYNSLGDRTVQNTDFLNSLHSDNSDIKIIRQEKIEKNPQSKKLSEHALSFNIGDSVVVTTTNQNGIVYKRSDDMGNLIVQIKGKKQNINHKRIKLLAPASELYPPDYDFSIIFDTVENRKAKHIMTKKHDENAIAIIED